MSLFGLQTVRDRYRGSESLSGVKAEQPALAFPIRRQLRQATQLLRREFDGLATVKYCIHDIRGEEGEPEIAADVTFAKTLSR